MKKLVKNGMLCTESGVYEADLLIEDGVIREIGTEKQLVGASSVGYPAEAPLSRPRKPIEDILEYHA